MDQERMGIDDKNNLPKDLPNDIDQPSSAELAADLIREQATGPVPLGPAKPQQGEDVVLLVETVSLPDQPEGLAAESLYAGELGMGDADNPWYRSRWVYIGTGAALGTALAAAGTILLLKQRNARQQRIPLRGAQQTLRQWSNQLSEQTNRFTTQIRKPARQTKRLAAPISSLTEQANTLSDQAQRQLNRLTRRSRALRLNRLQRQGQANAQKWIKQTQQHLADLSHQASDQFNAVGSSIGATTSQAIGKTQEGWSQIKEGVAMGAAKTGEGIQSGWKFSRTFSLGAVAGALWAACFTPETGEATRQRIKQAMQSIRKRNK
jgi:gas vesicle protein